MIGPPIYEQISPNLKCSVSENEYSRPAKKYKQAMENGGASVIILNFLAPTCVEKLNFGSNNYISQ